MYNSRSKILVHIEGPAFGSAMIKMRHLIRIKGFEEGEKKTLYARKNILMTNI